MARITTTTKLTGAGPSVLRLQPERKPGVRWSELGNMKPWCRGRKAWVGVTPGTGKVNFKAVMARLKQGGFTSGPLIVECLEQGDLAKLAAEAKKARLFLEQLLGQKA